jgi:glycosyltransferase involved in cell wall biosynthesis
VAPDLAARNVVLAGLVPRAQVPATLARCHVLVSPRIGNRVTAGQYPQKLSTYLAAGRPVIGSDVNDQANVLALARCGLTFTAGDADGLARAIVALRDLPDADRLEMGRRGRRFAERCLSTTAVSVALGGLYEQMVS